MVCTLYIYIQTCVNTLHFIDTLTRGKRKSRKSEPCAAEIVKVTFGMFLFDEGQAKQLTDIIDG